MELAAQDRILIKWKNEENDHKLYLILPGFR